MKDYKINKINKIKDIFNFPEISISKIYSLLSVYPKQESFIFDEQECLNLIQDNKKHREYSISSIYYDDIMIGLIIYSWSKVTKKNIIIDNFFIDKEWQNKGFGEKSFKEIISDIYKKNLNIKNINLFVHPENMKAVRLFKKCGFSFTEKCNSYNENNMDINNSRIDNFILNARLTMIHYKIEYCSFNMILRKIAVA